MKADALFAAGDFAACAQQYTAAIRHFENSVEAHAGLGLCELKRNNVLRAVEALERASALSKELHQPQPEIAFHLASAHSRLGDRRAALGHLRQAVKDGFAQPSLLRADAGLERLLRSDAEFKKLLAQVEKASKTRPRSGGRH